jgi:hypothetical protein
MTGDYTFVLKDTATAAGHQIDLVCLTDADAMLIARGVAGHRHVEVWAGSRLVGQVHPAPAAMARAAAGGTATPQKTAASAGSRP